jgi:hypothetical protein
MRWIYSFWTFSTLRSTDRHLTHDYPYVNPILPQRRLAYPFNCGAAEQLFVTGYSALIGTSNLFVLAPGVIALFEVNSSAALARVVGVVE